MRAGMHGGLPCRARDLRWQRLGLAGPSPPLEARASCLPGMSRH